MTVEPRLGATALPDGSCQFVVWAPLAEDVAVHVVTGEERLSRLRRDAAGYHSGVVPNVAVGDEYVFHLGDGPERPDPASRSQQHGVHGPSTVLDPTAYRWSDDAWRGIPLHRFVIYELHVGAFTEEGTFDAVVPRLADLEELGVTAVELMPVGQFPGDRNWGYDGVYPFAAQASYGGLEGLQRLVDACHNRGLAVVLDVVYNHLGPEGNYLEQFGPYFTDAYRTPWGSAVNFDGPESDEVRRYFIENALYWLVDCHIDALRLDAIHAIKDFSARPFLAELSAAVKKWADAVGRPLYLIGESDLNNPRVLRREPDGLGLDAQWADDLHHAIHARLTGERSGYYADFGSTSDIAKALRQAYVYTGQYAPSRRRRHGSEPFGTQGDQFVVSTQTHDQVGNRKDGDRLSHLVSFEDVKLAAATMLLAPYVPMLFMGEEYAEDAPFLYFTSHGDTDLIEAVRHGRREEFASFGWNAEVPDPQDPATFSRCKLHWSLRGEGAHAALLAYYRKLLQLRRELPALMSLSSERLEVVSNQDDVIVVHRWAGSDDVLIALSYADAQRTLVLPCTARRRTWSRIIDSADTDWLGPGAASPRVMSGRASAVSLRPRSAVCYRGVGAEGDDNRLMPETE